MGFTSSGRHSTFFDGQRLQGTFLESVRVDFLKF
jgi:hypothetical protein